jgi:hypothetical protein
MSPRAGFACGFTRFLLLYFAQTGCPTAGLRRWTVPSRDSACANRPEMPGLAFRNPQRLQEKEKAPVERPGLLAAMGLATLPGDGQAGWRVLLGLRPQATLSVQVLIASTTRPMAATPACTSTSPIGRVSRFQW